MATTFNTDMYADPEDAETMRKYWEEQERLQAVEIRSAISIPTNEMRWVKRRTWLGNALVLQQRWHVLNGPEVGRKYWINVPIEEVNDGNN